LCNAVGHRKEEVNRVEVDIALGGVTGATGGDSKEEKQKCDKGTWHIISDLCVEVHCFIQRHKGNVLLVEKQGVP
jgi:hypothetical protein